MMTRLLLIFLMTFLSLNSLWASHWDLEYWQYVNWKNWENGPYTVYTLGELRLNEDLSKFYYSRISENFAYRVRPQLDLEAHFSFIYHKSRGATFFTKTNRLEFEFNPFHEFCSGITIKWRNRLELIKKQNISHFQYVFRHRIMIVFPKKNCRKLLSFKIYDEIFYDFETQKLTQNRFVPIEVSLALSSRLSLDIFLMIRNFYSFGSDEWYRSFVLGSSVNF